jgi:hypothetical protein
VKATLAADSQAHVGLRSMSGNSQMFSASLRRSALSITFILKSNLGTPLVISTIDGVIRENVGLRIQLALWEISGVLFQN